MTCDMKLTAHTDHTGIIRSALTEVHSKTLRNCFILVNIAVV